MENPIATVDENRPMLASHLPDFGVKSTTTSKPTSAKKSKIRTPLASRNINTPTEDRGHIARTNAKGDIVIYSPAFILKKESSSASASAAGSTSVIIEDLDAESDVPINQLDFEQFKKRNLSSLGRLISPVSVGAVAPHNTPADEQDNQASPPKAGQGELLIGKALLLPDRTPTASCTPTALSTSSSTEAMHSSSTSTGISPVHFSSQGLTPLVGTPGERNEMAKRMEQLEDKVAKQELAHQQERATFQSMIEKLVSQVEILNSRLSDS